MRYQIYYQIFLKLWVRIGNIEEIVLQYDFDISLTIMKR